MKRTFIILLLGISILNGASFDCAKASTNIENTICGSPSGAYYSMGLDERLSNKYIIIKKALPQTEKKIFIQSQKEWLKERNKNCETHYNIESCLKPMYEKRIAFFDEKYKKILFNFPSKNEYTKVCEEVSKNPKLFIKKYGFKTSLRQTSQFDFNNDGIIENILTKPYGNPQLHNTFTTYTLNNGKEIDSSNKINFNDDDRWAHGPIFFKMNEKVFSLYTFSDTYYNETVKPMYMTYFNQSNEEYLLCRFENKTVEVMIPNKDIEISKKLCPLVNTKTESTRGNFKNYPSINGVGKLKHIELTKNSELNSSYFKKRYNKSWSLYKDKQESFDYNNDGKQETIIQIEHSSTKKRLCDVVHFDEVFFNKSTSRNLLLKLQNIDIDSYPICSSNSGFFKYKDKYYYEDLKDKKHNILQIKDNKISTICTGSFKTKTSVIYVKD